MHGTLHRLSAFADGESGGNPAGVWIGQSLPNAGSMQKIAAEVGFSETAFVAPATGTVREVRYFSPEAEVSFCGHATIATGVALGSSEKPVVYKLQTSVGEVPVTVQTRNGITEASLVSIEPQYKLASDELTRLALNALDWREDDLDKFIQPAKAYAGAWHLVMAVSTSARLADLHYDFDNLKALMLQENLTTLQLIWRASETVFEARNPFPVGGVVEDPATGAAAAALGGYLRDVGLIKTPATFTIRQGETMGRPSLIRVEVPTAGGIAVSGRAVEI